MSNPYREQDLIALIDSKLESLISAVQQSKLSASELQTLKARQWQIESLKTSISDVRRDIAHQLKMLVLGGSSYELLEMLQDQQLELNNQLNVIISQK